jgi:hypothetical protein
MCSFYETKLDYNSTEKILIFHTDYILSNPHIIEFIYGRALYCSNIRIISLINLFVREHNVLLSFFLSYVEFDGVVFLIYFLNRNLKNITREVGYFS